MSKIISKDDLREYFKYASGEIILTVIGIIIGLQVHVWTERRAEKKEVETIVGNLGNEFIQNKKYLLETEARIKSSLDNAKNLIQLIGEKKSTLEQYNIDSLMAVSLVNSKFSPSEDVISVLLETGKLKLIKDEKVRNLVYSWSSNRVILDGSFEDLHVNTVKLFEYLTKHYSLKDFDYYTSERLLGRSKLKIDKYAIFQDIVFENHLDNQIYYMHSYLEELGQIKGLIDRIIETSN